MLEVFASPSPELYVSPSPAYPLKISANGRYLVDQNNQPTLIVGDDAYSIFSQLSTTDATTYLQDRANRGFNTVWGGLTDNVFSNNAPNNINGQPVFTGALFTTPNPAWFSQCDTVINAAASLGLQMILTPLYLGNPANQGWGAQVQAASTSALASFGNYLGSRYAGFPNIIWAIGGDVDPSNVSGIGGYGTPTDMRPLVSAFANGLLTTDTGHHLFTAHNIRGQMATTPWGTSTGWLNLNDTYTTDVTSAVLAGTAYGQSPTMPFFQIEAYNENEHSTTGQDLRAQLYWTILAGGCGHVFGNCPLWGFDYSGVGAFCSSTAWQSNLDTVGAHGITRAAALLRPRQWYNLVPDTSHTLVTAGYGTLGSANYCPVAQSADRRLMLAYLPLNTTLTVNMAQFPGVSRARWYDPIGGAYVDLAGSPFVNDGLRTFTPSATNSAGDADWVLIIDALDPGMSQSWMNV